MVYLEHINVCHFLWRKNQITPETEATKTRPEILVLSQFSATLSGRSSRLLV